MKDTTIKLTVPDSWNQVTIKQYQLIINLKKTTSINIISILTNQDEEIIKSLDINTITNIINHLNWTNTLDIKEVYKPIIKIDNKEYGFISKLTSLTVGEWIDLEHYIGDLNNNIHNIFSILYKPLITAYSDTDRLLENTNNDETQRRAELFKEKAMIGDLYGALVFFCLIVKESTTTIQDFLTQEIAKMQMK